MKSEFFDRTIKLPKKQRKERREKGKYSIIKYAKILKRLIF